MEGRSAAVTDEANKAPLSAAAAIEAIPKDFMIAESVLDYYQCSNSVEKGIENLIRSNFKSFC